MMCIAVLLQISAFNAAPLPSTCQTNAALQRNILSVLEAGNTLQTVGSTLYLMHM